MENKYLSEETLDMERAENNILSASTVKHKYYRNIYLLEIGEKRERVRRRCLIRASNATELATYNTVQNIHNNIKRSLY